MADFYRKFIFLKINSTGKCWNDNSDLCDDKEKGESWIRHKLLLYIVFLIYFWTELDQISKERNVSSNSEVWKIIWKESEWKTGEVYTM